MLLCLFKIRLQFYKLIVYYAATTPVETKPKPKPVETVHESVNLTTPQQKSNPPPQQNKQDIVHEPVSLNLQSTPKPAAQDPDNRVYKKYRVIYYSVEDNEIHRLENLKELKQEQRTY